jgi:hypothetical protein
MDPEERKYQKAVGNCLVRSFIICAVHPFFFDEQIKGRLDGRKLERDKNGHKISVGKSEEKTSLGRHRCELRIMLKLILNK